MAKKRGIPENFRPRHWFETEATSRVAPPPEGWTEALAGVAEAMFRRSEGEFDPQRLNWLCAKTKELAEGVGPRGNALFRASLYATDWLSPVISSQPPPLRNLPVAVRLEVLEKFEASPVGMTLWAVKAFLSIAYFEHPDIADETGFDATGMRYPDEVPAGEPTKEQS